MIEDVLEEYGGKLVESLTKNLRTRGYKNQGSIASKALLESLSYEVKVFTDKYILRLNILNYYKWVDEGRKPGKQPPPNVIREWIQLKPNILRDTKLATLKKTTRGRARSTEVDTLDFRGIKSLSYLIGRKIAKEGTKPTYFFTDAFDEIIPELTTALSKDLGREIKITIGEK